MLILAFMFSSASYPIALGRDTVGVYLYSITVDTTSDWVRVEIKGSPKPVSYEVRLLEGSRANGLRYNVDPSLIAINKDELDTTRVVVELRVIALRGAEDGWISIVKGDIGYVEVSLHAWSKGGYKRYWSYNWSGALREPLNLHVDYSVVYEDVDGYGYYEDQPVTTDRVIYAFYYPWYGVPSISGNWIHWDVAGESIVNAAGTPILGIYDSSDPRLIDAHILLAKYSGVDAFIVSWWGIGSFEDRNLAVILGEAERYGFNISVYYESYRPWDPPSFDDVVNELIYIVKKYSGSPAYLKFNGKPVIFIYNVKGHDRTPDFWLKVREEVEKAVGQVYLVGDTRSPEYLHVFDGFHTYIDINRSSMREIYMFYREYMSIGLKGDDYKTAFTKIRKGLPIPLQAKSIFYTVTPGYDDTKVRDPGRTLARRNGSTYAGYWSDALALNATRILITSWNELHEGTQIEPTVEDGFLYIDLTRIYASLLKNKDITTPKPSVASMKYMEVSGGSIVLLIKNTGESPVMGVWVTISDGGVRLKDPYGHIGYGENMVVIPLIYPGESYKLYIEPRDFTRVIAVGLEYYGIGGERGVLSSRIEMGLGSERATSPQIPRIMLVGDEEDLAGALRPLLPALLGIVLIVVLFELSRRVTRA